MRDLAVLRDRHCAFPGCGVDARACDLDHITPYQPDGPPGQTSPANLACLCRRHHRAKTLGLWRYARTADGDCHWHGPHDITGRRTDALVEEGAQRLSRAPATGPRTARQVS